MWVVHEGMGWWMVFGGLWMVLFWAVLVGATAWIISRLVGARGEDNSGVDILKERYARGEIGREEFDRMRRDLGRPMREGR